MSGKQLGFIGVGTMGHHMAGRLLEAGYDPLFVQQQLGELVLGPLQRLAHGHGGHRFAEPSDQLLSHLS